MTKTKYLNATDGTLGNIPIEQKVLDEIAPPLRARVEKLELRVDGLYTQLKAAKLTVLALVRQLGGRAGVYLGDLDEIPEDVVLTYWDDPIRHKRFFRVGKKTKV